MEDYNDLQFEASDFVDLTNEKINRKFERILVIIDKEIGIKLLKGKSSTNHYWAQWNFKNDIAQDAVRLPQICFVVEGNGIDNYTRADGVPKLEPCIVTARLWFERIDENKYFDAFVDINQTPSLLETGEWQLNAYHKVQTRPYHSVSTLIAHKNVADSNQLKKELRDLKSRATSVGILKYIDKDTAITISGTQLIERILQDMRTVKKIYDSVVNLDSSPNAAPKKVYEDILINTLKMANKNSEPLNTILYGPPGTGKTFITKRRSVEIIEMQKNRKSIELIKIQKNDVNVNETFSLIGNISEIQTNMLTFNNALEKNEQEIIRRLSQFGHWYYSNKLNMFGPSKFIGYRNMTVAKYTNLYDEGLTGTATEQILAKFSNNTTDISLQKKLEELLNSFEKRPRENYSMHILKE